MTATRSPDDLTLLVQDALGVIAPDADPAALDADLHDDLGLDSMDLLNLAEAISTRAGIEIPERDYGRLTTMRRLVDYLVAAG
jgi:acyl carrier protein